MKGCGMLLFKSTLMLINLHNWVDDERRMNNLEKEVVMKNNQIENLKNSNLLLHKNIVVSYKSDKNSDIVK